MAIVLAVKPRGLFPARGGCARRARGRPLALRRGRSPRSPCPSRCARSALDFYLSLASRILVFAIAATSLNLVLGYGGLVSFGHAAFFGVGAYATAILISRRRAERAARISLATVVDHRAGGALVDRRDLAAHARRLLHHDHARLRADALLLRHLGEGLRRRRRPDDPRPLAVRDRRRACSTSRTRSPSTTSRSPCSRSPSIALALRAVALRPRRARPARRRRRAEALGFATYRYKLVVFVVAGTLGGLAGALSANLQGYVSPDMLHWTQSGKLMVMVILGGVATLCGGVIGAAAFCCCGSFSRHTPSTPSSGRLGAAGGRAFARQGLVGLLAAAAAAELAVSGAQDAPLLRVRGLRSASAASSPPTASTSTSRAGEIHALIGPNGAGKTTLVAPALRPARAGPRHDRACRQRHHRAGRRTARPPRPRPHVPDHAPLPHLTAVDTSPSPCRRRAARLSLPAAGGAGHADRTRRPRMLARRRPRRRRRAGRPALARRARALELALRSPPAAASPARRTHGRPRPHRVGAHGASSIRASARKAHAAHRTRSRRRVRLADRISVLVDGRLLATGAAAAVRADAR